MKSVFICLQDGESHVDMVYITESIIAVGFPGADLEANYQNLVDELMTFCESEHPVHSLSRSGLVML